MKLSSRQADLAILRHSLVEHGKRDGQYPDDLGQVLRETNLAGRIREQEFVFPAAGKPYDKKAEHFVLFYERTAHSYGPWRGRYLYFQDYWCFCLDQNSGIGEQEGGGLL